MVANSSKKSLKDCEIINQWAYSIPLMRLLKKEDDLYLDELYLLSLIYSLVNKFGRPIKQVEISRVFNVLSYRREKMILNLTNRGFIKNDMDGPSNRNKAFRFIVSPLGEQLLIKYEKAMRRLCEGEK